MRLIASLLAAGLVFSAGQVHAQSQDLRVGVIPVIGAAPIFVVNGEGWAKESGLDFLQVHRLQVRSEHDPGPRLGHHRPLRWPASCPPGGRPDKGHRGEGRRRDGDRRNGIRRSAQACALLRSPEGCPGGCFEAVPGQGGPPRPAWPRSRPAPCRTPRSSTGSGRSPRPIRRMSRSSPWASTPPSRPVPRGRGGRRFHPRARAHHRPDPQNPHIKLIAVGGEMFPNQPGTVVGVRGRVPRQESGGGPKAGFQRPRARDRSAPIRSRPRRAARRRRRSARASPEPENDPEGADLARGAGGAVRRRPDARSWTGDPEDAVLSCQASIGTLDRRGSRSKACSTGPCLRAPRRPAAHADKSDGRAPPGTSL